MDKLKDEVDQLKKQSEELIKERDTALQERDSLKQQCAEVIRKSNLIFLERNNLQEIIRKMELQHEKAIKELKTIIVRNEKNDELNYMKKAYLDAVQDYKLVLGERDIVHKEIEMLSSDLSFANKKNEILEKEIKSCKNEIKSLQISVKCFKHELSSILQDRDKALQKCFDYQEKFGDIVTEDNSHREYKINSNDEINVKKEIQNSLPEKKASLHIFKPYENKQIDNIEQANQEIKFLRTLVDQFYTELNESLKESNISQKRRDWAFDERDKIMLERESLRTQCDTLRKQRNDTLSKEGHILKFLEDLQKQKNNHAKELNDQEDRTTQFGKEIHLLQLMANYLYNKDSAIDLQNEDTEILNIDLNFSDSNENLGIHLLGGKDEPLYPNDNAIYISFVDKGSLAARKLRVNDCILKVNNLDCSLISKHLVLKTMKTFSSANLVIRRKKSTSSSQSVFKTHLLNHFDHGISLESGVYINNILPGSLASNNGNLGVGDRVLSINNISMDNITLEDAMLLLNKSTDVLTITTIKSSHCAKYCGSGRNPDVFKKYINSTSQTDKSSTYSMYQESYQKLQYVQSRRVMQGVPEKPIRNLSLINNAISEHDQGGAIGGLNSVSDVLKSFTASTTITTTTTSTTTNTHLS